LNRAADERAQREKVDFIAELLPVLDNLQQAVEVAKDDPSNPIVEGLRGVLANFESSLAGAGVEPIEAINEEFNPELHEAVEISAVEPEMDGRVVGEYSRGYRIGDRLLRAARVKVGRYSENTNRVAS
jgi:molecular chaperone GrpE